MGAHGTRYYRCPPSGWGQARRQFARKAAAFGETTIDHGICSFFAHGTRSAARRACPLERSAPAALSGGHMKRLAVRMLAALALVSSGHMAMAQSKTVSS